MNFEALCFPRPLRWQRKSVFRVLHLVLIFFSALSILPTYGDAAKMKNQAAKQIALKGPGLDPKGEIFRFGKLFPMRKSYTIEGIKLSHESSRSVPISISVLALRHAETNFALSAKKWCHVFPSQGSASQDRPFEFDFKIALPKKIPAGIPDGLYAGTLLIRSPEAARNIRQKFLFTLDLPDFTPVPANLSEEGIDIEMNCCIPDEREFSLKLTTDAKREQIVRVMAPSLLINEETGESIAAEEAEITILPGNIQDADKVISTGNKPTHISFNAQVKSQSMEPGSYSGELAIRAELGRTLYVPFRLIIPSSFLVERFRVYSIIAAAFFLLLWLLWPTRRLIQGRNRFQQRGFRIGRTGKNIRIPNPWNHILAVQYLPNVNNWQITPTRGYQISSDRPDALAPSNTVNVGQRQGTIINVTRGRERYRLRVSGSAGTTMLLNIRVLRSPYHLGRSFFVWMVMLALTTLCVWSITNPEIWCRLI